MQVEEDRRLLRGMRRGDQAALRRLYEKHKDDLLTVAVSLTLDMAAAEDVLHDVFVRFAENANRVHLRSSLKAYLATSVANRARDRFRAAVRGAFAWKRALQTAATAWMITAP